jgi:hypothetical protein
MNTKRAFALSIALLMIFAGCSEKPTDNGNANSIQFDHYGAPSGVSGSRVIAAKNGDLFLPAGWNGLYRKKPTGNWEILDVTHSGGYIEDVAVTQNGNIVSAAQGKGIYYSTDNGDHWNASFINNSFITVRFYVGHIFELWYATDDGNGTLTAYRSEDNGLTWSRRNTPSGDNERSIALAFNSVDHVYFANEKL